MNFSFFIVDIILDLNSNVTLAIRALGENLFNKKICFSELINTINTNMSINSSSINIFSVNGLIKSTLTLSLLNLLFSYLGRNPFIFLRPISAFSNFRP